MKKLVVLFSIPFLMVSCKSDTKTNNEKEIDNIEEYTTAKVTYVSYGEKIDDKNVLSKPEIIEKYNNLKVGDTLVLKFTTKVNEVCQSKGCWMLLDLGDNEARVSFKDYGFFIPKNIADKEVIVNGKAYISEMSMEEQRHYAEDAGKTKEEIEAIIALKTTLSFEADGVLLIE